MTIRYIPKPADKALYEAADFLIANGIEIIPGDYSREQWVVLTEDLNDDEMLMLDIIAAGIQALEAKAAAERA